MTTTNIVLTAGIALLAVLGLYLLLSGLVLIRERQVGIVSRQKHWSRGGLLRSTARPGTRRTRSRPDCIQVIGRGNIASSRFQSRSWRRAK